MPNVQHRWSAGTARAQAGRRSRARPSEARTDLLGDLITLEEQDRSRWNRAEIDPANEILNVTIRRNGVGPYQLQALIAACHANAPTAGATDWARIAALYVRLLEVTANPVVKLNHAIAAGMATDPKGGLALLDRLAASAVLRDYHLLHATRADFLRRLGRNDEAADAYRQALALVRTETERRYLTRRLKEVSIGPASARAEGA